MMIRLAILTLLIAEPVAAACSSEEATFLSCQIERSAKRLEVCVEGDQIIYRFGPEAAPELQLERIVHEIDYRPWPGVGSAIWEEITFKNNDISYIIHAGVERTPPGEASLENPVRFGGVAVRDAADKVLVELSCDREKDVGFYWTESLSEAHQRAGLTYDQGAFRWVPASN